MAKVQADYIKLIQELARRFDPATRTFKNLVRKYLAEVYQLAYEDGFAEGYAVGHREGYAEGIAVPVPRESVLHRSPCPRQYTHYAHEYERKRSSRTVKYYCPGKKKEVVPGQSGEGDPKHEGIGAGQESSKVT
jgi:hypothetical protein